LNQTFNIGNLELHYLNHNYNCGTGNNRTERCVEVPIATYWCSKHDNIAEVGAVLPYYYNSLTVDIIDPSDTHKAVNHRKSLFDYDFYQRDVLSISTLEHIGTGEYGVKESNTAYNALSALDHILFACSNYLITLPFGCNSSIDSAFINHKLDSSVVYMMTRQKDGNWLQVNSFDSLREYGSNMANSIIILTNRELLVEKPYYGV
jgi:hypothetical protein